MLRQLHTCQVVKLKQMWIAGCWRKSRWWYKWQCQRTNAFILHISWKNPHQSFWYPRETHSKIGKKMLFKILLGLCVLHVAFGQPSGKHIFEQLNLNTLNWYHQQRNIETQDSDILLDDKDCETAWKRLGYRTFLKQREEKISNTIPWQCLSFDNSWQSFDVL